jgi:hypothetical protein
MKDLSDYTVVKSPSNSCRGCVLWTEKSCMRIFELLTGTGCAGKILQKKEKGVKKRFLQFLKDEGVFEKYKANFARDGRKLKPHAYVRGAFFWSDAPEGIDFWSDIYEKWDKILEQEVKIK